MISPLVLLRVFEKQEPALLTGSKSVETTNGAPKVTSTEVERPTDLAVTASHVKAEQCPDEVKIEQRNTSVKELEPSINLIPVLPDELRCWIQVGIGGFPIRALYDTDT